jgi:3-hydroxy acid dehydrogenase / malonic semialdehyde reductase
MSLMQDKIVFITGASSGIGMACAKYFAMAGAKLVLCARRIELLNELGMHLLSEYGTDIHTLELDVRDRAQVDTALITLPPLWKKIDVLINNAGLAAGLDTIQEGNIQDWEDMIDTNVKGLLYVTRAILPEMIARNSGHVINIGSIAGHQVYAKGVVYCATKYAVKALSEGLRLDLFGTHVRVSSVDPGAVATNFSAVRFKGDQERAAAVYQGMQPLTPEDVADAVLYCATRPSHINVNEVFITPTAQASATLISRVAQDKT